MTPPPKQKKAWFGKSVIYIGLVVLTIACIIPFLMMIINATRSNEEVLSGFSLIPGNSLAENYAALSSYVNIWSGFKNSLIIAVLVTVLSGYFSALTAFGFAFYQFKGKNAMFVFMLVMMMVPGQLGLIGFYELSKNLGLLDSYIPLIVPAIASPFTVFFVRQYVQTVLHPSLIEAARMDGASEFRIFHTIALPMMMPAIATMSIFTFIGSWNNYIMPLVLLFSPEKYTLPVLMGFLKGSQVAENLGSLYLGIAISVVPIMIAFLFLSKYIVSSISAGAVKE
ncbi:sugar ABC transporter permease [Exiguobacterium sp. Leaf187]|uniref:Sugar ABC transporter permease n=1 Tax=Exiguobacterium indicum TaxID=296995 RepID=A0A0V8GFC2_9BACL|nr:sugar ABC transporter permease [Exiguobacterium sp. U13-1]KOP30907.1 sugar ABC transporter permease [Exiguobacterium sp. BMC-KP]KQS16187.1 sugar ABC transporter permease [Exiguobacterium sp. Leaf187]KSU48960.1 sugar ABC transporter permease [Exiguobacterium enclense]KTR27305.1 sugar ABC transporter permease [Exiguobacterium indicum]OAI85319.1 sugar ABC transporter permease [Exiguobacterium sp. KKBO11]